MIDEPTHIEGHLLDQAYLKDENDTLQCTIELQSKYYTDHKGLAITINQDWKGKNQKILRAQINWWQLNQEHDNRRLKAIK